MYARLYFEVASSPRLFLATFRTFSTNLTAQQEAVAIRTAYQGSASLAGLYPGQVRLVRTEVNEVDQQGIDETAVPGVNGAQALAPPNVTMLVTKVGGLRRRQGRLFLPGVWEGSVDDLGNLTTSYQSHIQPRLTQFLTNLTNAGVQMVQTGPRTGDPGAPVPVTALVLSTRVATQRRRLR